MTFNINILISLIVATVYAIYTFFILKITPQLSDILSLMIPSVALITSILFVVDLINSKKSLGDYEEHKYILFVGSFAIMWVSGQTIIEKFIM